MSEDELEVRVPKMRIEVNGTKWDFQEFCQHFARYFEFLDTLPGYTLELLPDMEGMVTDWRLMEKSFRGQRQLGPTLTFSNVRNGWTNCNALGEFEINYIEVGADPLLTKQINLASI